jgi:nucleotide-binding universal stress UspA family protein
MYEKIVVLLDGSELAERVLPHVEEIAHGRGSQVHLLSVVPIVVPAAVTADVYPVYVAADFLTIETAERKRVRGELEVYLSGIAERLGRVASMVEVIVRFGRPADEILAYAEEIEAGLIAMCTHGRSGLSRWVFGSVAEKVLRGASCPVLLVRVQ